MGFDSLKDIKFIRLAHEAGLGCGDIKDIEIVGDTDALNEKWNFIGPFKKMTFASKCQHLIYWGPLKKPVEWSLKTILAPWSYIASVVYHDLYWYPRNFRHLQNVLNSDWGRLFANWEQLALPSDDVSSPGWSDPGDKTLEISEEMKEIYGKAF